MRVREPELGRSRLHPYREIFYHGFIHYTRQATAKLMSDAYLLRAMLQKEGSS